MGSSGAAPAQQLRAPSKPLPTHWGELIAKQKVGGAHRALRVPCLRLEDTVICRPVRSHQAPGQPQPWRAIPGAHCRPPSPEVEIKPSPGPQACI